MEIQEAVKNVILPVKWTQIRTQIGGRLSTRLLSPGGQLPGHHQTSRPSATVTSP